MPDWDAEIRARLAGLRLTGGREAELIAFAGARFVESFLFGVSARDAATFVTVPLLLGAVALLACLWPARRAARLDPMVALRYR